MNMMIVCVIPAAAEADVESRVKKHRHPVIFDDEDETDVGMTEPPAQKRRRQKGMRDF